MRGILIIPFVILLQVCPHLGEHISRKVDLSLTAFMLVRKKQFVVQLSYTETQQDQHNDRCQDRNNCFFGEIFHETPPEIYSDFRREAVTESSGGEYA